ncbi:hypothetical protein [Streptomyces nojiriensis]|uniref:hypothetical protein n=1 Tax=Streptomyces nojiriensis TaxID=66374 RepID=UPI0036544885
MPRDDTTSTAVLDAAVQALLDTGIRGVHASLGPHFGDRDRQRPGDLARLRRRVLVAGTPRKWNGQVLDVDLPALREEVRASRTYVLGAAGGPAAGR